jgi:hypothetical protein
VLVSAAFAIRVSVLTSKPLGQHAQFGRLGPLGISAGPGMTSAAHWPQNSRGSRLCVPDMHGDRLHAGIPMTTSPNFAEYQSDQTAGHPAAAHNGETNGNGHSKFVDANARSTERRRRPPPSSPEEYSTHCPRWRY